MEVSSKTEYRFFDACREPCTTMGPIEGYMKEHIRTLEYAVEPVRNLVPNLDNHVKAAKERARNPSDGLSWDESAAIALYTMEWGDHTDSVFYKLNTDLRNENRESLKPWFRYLRLLLSGLQRLPLQQRSIYRGVKFNHSSFLQVYQKNAEIIWWGFSSCSAKRDVAERVQFLGNCAHPVVFKINSFSGVDVSSHSFFRNEYEVILFPGVCVKVTNINQENNWTYIQLEEIDSPFQVLESFSGRKKKRGLQAMMKIFKKPETDIKETEENDTTANFVVEQPRIHFDKTSLSQAAIITGTKFNDDNIDYVIRQVTDKKCKDLLLRENSITHRGMMKLAENIQPPLCLRSLMIAKNHIGDRGAQYIADALSNTSSQSIEELSLVEANINDDGAKCLAKMLGNNRTLTKISLAANNIGDHGFQEIVNALSNNGNRLQNLALDWNKFGNDESAEALGRMIEINQSIIFINISSCKFSESGKKKLKHVAKKKDKLKLLL